MKKLILGILLLYVLSNVNAVKGGRGQTCTSHDNCSGNTPFCAGKGKGLCVMCTKDCKRKGIDGTCGPCPIGSPNGPLPAPKTSKAPKEDEPKSTEPATKPKPTKPKPVDPKPKPTKPQPVDPKPTIPTDVPKPTDPSKPVDPKPPKPTKPDEPKPSQPANPKPSKPSNPKPKPSKPDQGVVCMQDVKKCADGSYVSRDPMNNCEFKTCRCLLKPETGKCRAAIPRFYYDATDGKCKEFTYGGCGGNKNNFINEVECAAACAKHGDGDKTDNGDGTKPPKDDTKPPKKRPKKGPKKGGKGKKDESAVDDKKGPKGKGPKGKGPKGKGPKGKGPKGGKDGKVLCDKHFDCPRTAPFCAKMKNKKGKKGKGKGGEKDKKDKMDKKDEKKEGDKGKKGKDGKDEDCDDDDDDKKPKGVCKPCSECNFCSDGVEGTCGKKCGLIFPRKRFPLKGPKVCERDPPPVDCEVCHNGSFMIGCKHFECVRDGKANDGSMVAKLKMKYEGKACGDKDSIANYCVDWAEER